MVAWYSIQIYIVQPFIILKTGVLNNNGFWPTPTDWGGTEIHYYYKAWPTKLFIACLRSLLRVSFFCPYLFFLLLFFLFLFFCSIFFCLSLGLLFFFYPKPLFPRWAMWLQSNGLFFSSKSSNTGDRGGSGHRFLEILKKEHVQIQGGVFMKNSWNFHWLSWFRLWNFNQQGVSHYFAEFAGVKGCFFYLKRHI